MTFTPTTPGRFWSGLFLLCLGVLIASTARIAPTTSWAGEVGSPFVVASGGARFPDVAYNSLDGKYLVVYMQYPSPAQIYGRFVTAAGATSGSGFPISNSPAQCTLFPSIAYNAMNGEFLVTWDDERGGDATSHRPAPSAYPS